MRKRRIPDIRECMTAVTVEYRSRRPEIETEIFCLVCLRPRFGLYVRIGFPARIEHRNIICETYRTEVGHAAVSVFSEEGLLRFPKASSCRDRVFCRTFISRGRKDSMTAAGMSRHIPDMKACRPCFRSLRIFWPDRYGCFRLSPCRPCYGSASGAICPVPFCQGIG